MTAKRYVHWATSSHHRRHDDPEPIQHWIRRATLVRQPSEESAAITLDTDCALQLPAHEWTLVTVYPDEQGLAPNCCTDCLLRYPQ